MTDKKCETGTSYSVVIPAFNAAATIAEAIRSILRQTLKPQKIVVVDDGSTDDTADIAGDFGLDVIVVRKENAGVSAATNAGIDAVTTPLLACLDADDIWLAEKMACQFAYMAANPDVDATFTQARLFRHGRAVDPAAPVRDLWGRTTMLIPTAKARKIGPLVDPGGAGRGDMVDWIGRGRDLGMRFDMVPKVLALRRLMHGSMSNGFDQRDVGYLMAVKAALDRRRSRTDS